MAQELQYHFASRDLRSPTSCIALGGSSIIRSFRFFSSSSRLPTDRTRAIRHAYMYICVFGLLIPAIHFPSASNRILAGVRFRDEVRLRVRHAIRVFPDSASRDIRRFIGLLQILLSRLKRIIWIFQQAMIWYYYCISFSLFYLCIFRLHLCKPLKLSKLVRGKLRRTLVALKFFAPLPLIWDRIFCDARKFFC